MHIENSHLASRSDGPGFRNGVCGLHACDIGGSIPPVAMGDPPACPPGEVVLNWVFMDSVSLCCLGSNPCNGLREQIDPLETTRYKTWGF